MKIDGNIKINSNFADNGTEICYLIIQCFVISLNQLYRRNIN